MSLADEAALYRLAVLYARAVDRNDPDTLAGLFDDDAVIEAPGFELRGLEAIRGIPGMLKARFHRTLHVLHQQLAEVSGDRATAETHCTAHHLSLDRPETDLVWTIRYQDEFRRSETGWRFTHRRLLIDWTETRPVTTALKEEPK